MLNSASTLTTLKEAAIQATPVFMDVAGTAEKAASLMGKGYHRESQKRLHQVTVDNGHPAPVVSSAGALVDGSHLMGAERISIVTPYMRRLTNLVAAYIKAEGAEVSDCIALEIPDSLEVAAQDPQKLLEIYKRLNLRDIEALVLSACVQMPSLAAIQKVEVECDIPVLSASVVTTHQMLNSLGLRAEVAGCGALLSGNYA